MKQKIYLSNNGILKTPGEIATFRAEKLQAIAQMKFKYDCSVCLIIRDENEYLEEWLRWHIGQGVQHFYIYDHGSKNPVSGFLEGLGTEIASKVTSIDWSGPHGNAQPEAYNDCLKRLGFESRWIGFIDADEHVCVKTGQSLTEFLSGYSEYAGVMAIWRTFGASGQKEKINAPLRKRFTKVVSHQWSDSAGKVFVQPSLMKDMFIHNGHTVDYFEVVGEWKDLVADYSITKEDPTTDLICVDHFYTKSYDEWLEKLRRGRCHLQHARKYAEFFEYNPDMAYCRENVYPVQKYEVSNKAM